MCFFPVGVFDTQTNNNLMFVLLIVTQLLSLTLDQQIMKRDMRGILLSSDPPYPINLKVF